jgi:hypothetical protein
MARGICWHSSTTSQRVRLIWHSYPFPHAVALVLNAGLGANGDIRLAQALATTMRRVFTSVFVLETSSSGNWMLIGTIAPIGDGAANFAENYQSMQDPAMRIVMEKTRGFPFLQSDDGAMVLYDDHAPVEQLVDEMIIGTITQ